MAEIIGDKNTYLSHMDESLCNSDDEELVSSRISLVVAGEKSQVLGQLGVVRTGADQA